MRKKRPYHIISRLENLFIILNTLCKKNRSQKHFFMSLVGKEFWWETDKYYGWTPQPDMHFSTMKTVKIEPEKGKKTFLPFF